MSLCDCILTRCPQPRIVSSSQSKVIMSLTCVGIQISDDGSWARREMLNPAIVKVAVGNGGVG